MKTTRTKTLVGLALTCLALAGSSSLFAAGTTFIISTFDSDLSAQPFGTNFWPYLNDTPEPTAVTWTNSGNPAGAMAVDLDWATTAGVWDWQDAKCQVEPWSTNGLPEVDTNNNPNPIVDLSKFDFLEFDAAVDQAHSHTNDAGGYGGIQCIVQTYWGMGNNPSNIDNGYHVLGDATLPVTNGWQHYKISVASWPWSVSVLTLGFHMQQNQAQAIHVKALIDNVKFTALGVPPTMAYVKAARGLSIWQTGGQYDRNSIEINPGGTYMPTGDGPSTYSFTLSAYPTQAAKSNYIFRMYLIPSQPTDTDPDWSEPNAILMELTTDTNNVASWMFRWKTNAPNDNGNLYQANGQISITNPTPLGKWTLGIDSSGQSVTMTAPGGNTTNFVMGVHTNVPDISSLFGGQGEIYLGSYSSGANKEQIDLVSTLSAAEMNCGGIPYTNYWPGDTTLTNSSVIYPSSWTQTGVTYMIIPVTNDWFVNWTIPDGGFALQTNTASVGSPSSWSTNHGLSTLTFPNHHGALTGPTILPNTPKLLFRLSNPGY